MTLQIVRSGVRVRRALILLFLGIAPGLAYSQPPPTTTQPPPTTTPPPTTAPQPPATTTTPETPAAAKADEEGVMFVGAGDIANCEVAGGGGARSTAALLERYPDAVIFTTGDHAYQQGSDKDFKTCYEPTWGKFK